MFITSKLIIYWLKMVSRLSPILFKDKRKAAKRPLFFSNKLNLL